MAPFTYSLLNTPTFIHDANANKLLLVFSYESAFCQFSFQGPS